MAALTHDCLEPVLIPSRPAPDMVSAGDAACLSLIHHARLEQHLFAAPPTRLCHPFQLSSLAGRLFCGAVSHKPAVVLGAQAAPGGPRITALHGAWWLDR